MDELNEQNGLPELPKGWTWATIGEVVESIIEQGSPKDSEDFIYVDISSIDNKTKRIVEPKILPTNEAPSRAKQHLQSRDVLVSMTRPNLNAIAILQSEFSEAIGSTGFCVLRAIEVKPLLLFYLVQNETFVSAMSLLVQGALYPAVRPKDIFSHRFPLPPLNEQARIVAKIEELFTKLDAGVDALKQIQKQIKRYRQAVLRDAVTGELTKAWREENQAELEPAADLLKRILTERRERWEQEQTKKFAETGKTPKNDDWKKKYKEPTAPDIESLPELPESWTCVTLEIVSENIVDCLHSTAKFSDSGKYCVDTTCIKNGQILWDKIRFVSEETFIERVQRLLPQFGDILFAREGTIGTTVVVPENIELCLGQRMMMFRSISQILPNFQMYVMTSPMFEKQLKPKISGTTSPHINIGDLKLMFILLPPLAEQQKIVEEVERLLSVADAVEATVKQSLKQATRLRQSILKRGFEGNLVPQDDTDEPAQTLLERIKQERAEKAAESKSKKTKADQPKAKTKKAAQSNLPFQM